MNIQAKLLSWVEKLAFPGFRLSLLLAVQHQSSYLNLLCFSVICKQGEIQHKGPQEPLGTRSVLCKC